jgi:hypothetical protein
MNRLEILPTTNKTTSFNSSQILVFRSIGYYIQITTENSSDLNVKVRLEVSADSEGTGSSWNELPGTEAIIDEDGELSYHVSDVFYSLVRVVVEGFSGSADFTIVAIVK